MLRCLRPRRILLFYFSLLFLTIVWLIYNIESFCPPSTSLDALEEIARKTQELHILENRLKYLEKDLRRQFPQDIDRILNISSPSQPTIYAITPTYARPVQKAELVRLLQTFINVPNFHWIIIEDANRKSELVGNLLQRSGLKYTHLNEPTPAEYKLQPDDPNWLKPRGVLQRNKGLQWLRETQNPDIRPGVVYFADDDNTYSIDLFKEMRDTRKVSVWPVGLVGYLRYERPVVKSNKVKGWFTYWKPDRPFATDMAGFAINLKLFFDYPNAKFSNLVKRGELESDLISKIKIKLDDLEPKADSCTKVLVWHTRTEKPSLKNEDKLRAAGRGGSNPNVEV